MARRTPYRTLLTVSTVLFVLALARSGRALETLGFDTLVPPGAVTALGVQVWTGPLLRLPAPGLEVTYRLGGQVIGRAQTDINGLALLNVQAPSTPGDYRVEGEVSSPILGTSRTTLLLSVRARAQRVVIVDFERTVANGSFTEILLQPPAQVPPVRGAVAALTDIAQDALVVYLVGHDFVFGPEVRAWLAHWNLPRGVTIFGKEYVFWFSRSAYKAAIYRTIGLQHTIAAGFGEDAGDRDAAQALGLPFFAIGPRAQPGLGVPTFTDWDALRAANAAGTLPGLSWAQALR
ncbi:MAG: hypothetical protein D6776_05025 [Planctomycetota bacterium]|nr:MAG: hypothetical protein D6776_05025 [Planctomycetota bacterium]